MRWTWYFAGSRRGPDGGRTAGGWNCAASRASYAGALLSVPSAVSAEGRFSCDRDWRQRPVFIVLLPMYVFVGDVERMGKIMAHRRKGRVILARQKPPEQVPSWALCCRATQAQTRRQFEIGAVVKVRAGSGFLAEVTCPACGRVVQDRLYFPVIGPGRQAIAAEVYDFDEGSGA